MGASTGLEACEGRVIPAGSEFVPAGRYTENYRIIYSAKVMEVEDLRGAFTTETPKIVDAVRKALEPYVPESRDVDILGAFDMVKQGSGVTFKVGARVSEEVADGRLVESLWVFHFNETGVLKVETLRVKRGKDGLFVPANETDREGPPNHLVLVPTS